MNLSGKSSISTGSFGSRMRNRYRSLYDEKHLMGMDPFDAKLSSKPQGTEPKES